MESIEADYENLRGVLPKGEYQELDNQVLGQLLRTLNPEELKKVKGDVFGRIYEELPAIIKKTPGQTIGLDRQTVILLDALRKQRNVADYAGDAVPASAVDGCVSSAEELLQDVMHGLQTNKPQLLR